MRVCVGKVRTAGAFRGGDEADGEDGRQDGNLMRGEGISLGSYRSKCRSMLEMSTPGPNTIL